MTNKNPRAHEAAEAAAWAESDERQVRPDARVLRGEQAAEASRALLDQYANDAESLDLIERAVGRPTLGADRPSGTSPIWNIRASADLDVLARERAEAEGRNLSDLVRGAVSQYLAIEVRREQAAAEGRDLADAWAELTHVIEASVKQLNDELVEEPRSREFLRRRIAAKAGVPQKVPRGDVSAQVKLPAARSSRSVHRGR